MIRYLNLRVGIGAKKTVRDFLGKISIFRPSIRWHESKGIIESDFLISGDEESIKEVQRELSQWMLLQTVED